MDISCVQSQGLVPPTGRRSPSSATRIGEAGPGVQVRLLWSAASSEVHLRGSTQKIGEVLLVGFLF